MKAFKKHEMEECTYDLMCQEALYAQKKIQFECISN